MEKFKFNNAQFSKIVEIVILVLAFSALYFALVFLAPGGPISTDVTWYMNAGLNGIKDIFILNRYFHVFLQAVFLNTASTPLIGLQNYWAFLITGISLLIYLAARNLTSQNRPLHAVLAVSLFFSTGIVADTAGLPLVDITAMFMVLVFIIVYIASTRKMHESKVLIALLGFLFFLAFKTKETTLPIAILLLGLSIGNKNVISGKTFIQRILYFFIGICGGVVFFIILNWIFLGDLFYGLRLSEFSRFLDTYVAVTQINEKYSGPGNWFTLYIFMDLWIPFALFMLSGAKPTFIPDINRGIRLIWLVPLFGIIFVIMLIGNQYGYLQRYIYPTIPVICFLGPQFLNLDLRSVHDRRRRNTAIVIFIVGLLTMVAFRIIMKQIFLSKGWDVAIVMTAVFIPILFSVILALVFLWKRTPLFVSYLVSVLIIAITIISISHNVKQITIAQPNRKFSDKLFYPFSVFTGHINFSSDMEFYISPDVWREMETSYFLKDRLEISSLFNVFFDAGSTKYNFIIPEESSDIPGDLIKSDFTHVLLSTGDWQTISAMPEIRDQLENKYLFYSDDKNVLIFLKPKP